MVLVYVDDCLLFSPSDKVLDDMINLLNKQFKITSSTSIETYLGLEVSNNSDGSITLRQPGLIDKSSKRVGWRMSLMNISRWQTKSCATQTAQMHLGNTIGHTGRSSES
jgi:hypothetical protein